MRPTCDRPPVGWECSRRPGHEGPCAALPTQDCTCKTTATRTTFDEKCPYHGKDGTMVVDADVLVPSGGRRIAEGEAAVTDEYARAFEEGALVALDYITDERPDLEALTMVVAEYIGRDINAMLGRTDA